MNGAKSATSWCQNVSQSMCLFLFEKFSLFSMSLSSMSPSCLHRLRGEASLFQMSPPFMPERTSWKAILLFGWFPLLVREGFHLGPALQGITVLYCLTKKWWSSNVHRGYSMTMDLLTPSLCPYYQMFATYGNYSCVFVIKEKQQGVKMSL